MSNTAMQPEQEYVPEPDVSEVLKQHKEVWSKSTYICYTKKTLNHDVSRKLKKLFISWLETVTIQEFPKLHYFYC